MDQTFSFVRSFICDFFFLLSRTFHIRFNSTCNLRSSTEPEMILELRSLTMKYFLSWLEGFLWRKIKFEKKRKKNHRKKGRRKYFNLINYWEFFTNEQQVSRNLSWWCARFMFSCVGQCIFEKSYLRFAWNISRPARVAYWTTRENSGKFNVYVACSCSLYRISSTIWLPRCMVSGFWGWRRQKKEREKISTKLTDELKQKMFILCIFFRLLLDWKSFAQQKISLTTWTTERPTVFFIIIYLKCQYGSERIVLAFVLRFVVNRQPKSESKKKLCECRRKTI